MKNRYLDYLRNIINAIYSCQHPDTWCHLKSCNVLLVRHDWDCSYNFNGKAYGNLIDSLGDLLTQQGLITRSVASPFSKLVGEEAHNSPVSLNRSFFIIYLFGFVIRLLKGRIYYTTWYKNRNITLWKNLLKKAEPYCIIAIMPDESLCQAARQNKILIFDLQHGVIADDHYYYGYKTRIYSDINDLPNCFLCWDAPSQQILQRWTKNKGIEAKIIGNPWFLRFSHPHINDQLVQETQVLGKIFDNNKPNILFTLQWDMKIEYNSHEFNGVMISEIEKIIIETCSKYNWLLRLHPIQLLGKERKSTIFYLNKTFKKKCSNINWEKCSQLPLPVILQQTDIHITDSSTVTIEASWFGIQTGLLNQQIVKGGKYESYYQYEQEKGFAQVLPHSNVLIKKWISDQLINGRKKNQFNFGNKALHSFINDIVVAAKSTKKTI